MARSEFRFKNKKIVGYDSTVSSGQSPTRIIKTNKWYRSKKKDPDLAN